MTDVVEIKVCSPDVHAMCLYRMSREAAGLKGACQDNSSVLKGCPLILRQVGCHNPTNCTTVNQPEKIATNGRNFLVISGCKHHPNRLKFKLASREDVNMESQQAVPDDPEPEIVDDEDNQEDEEDDE